MATEPRTIVSIIDETIGLGNDPVDTNLNILCPIISPTGPTKLTRVTGPSMLRRYFNGNSAITPDSSQTLQFARAVSANAPIYVKRASRSEIKGGKTASEYSTNLYVDELNNPLTGGILELTKRIPSEYQYGNLLDEVLTGTSFVKTDENVYITHSEEQPEGAELALLKSRVVTQSVVKDGCYIYKYGGATTKSATVEIAGKKYTLAAGFDDFNDLFTSLIADGIKPIAWAGENIYYDRVNNSADLTQEDASIDELFFDIPIKITLDSDDAGKIRNTGYQYPKFYIHTLYSEDEYNNFKASAAPFSISAEIDEVTYHIHSDDVTYNPEYGTVDIEIASEDLTFDEAFKEIYDRLDLVATIGAESTSRFIVSGLTEVDTRTPGVGIVSRISADLDDRFSPPLSDMFGVVSKFPNESNSIKVNCVDNEDKTYTLTISAFGNEEMFTISFIPGAVDGYGNDIYYTNVEAQSDYVSVIYLGGNQVSTCTLDIGSEVRGEFVGIMELSETLEEMMETEESPVLFDYILDGGIVDKSYSSMILQACEYYKAFYPASVQTDLMSVYNMKNNRARLGNTQPSCRTNCIAAAQRDSVLDSGIVTMPASYYYLVYRIGLARSVREFIAAFGRTNGNIGITNPIKDFKKSDRESMLGQQIVTLKRSMGDGSWYLNLNMTCYGTDSYLQEDGIVLMCNKIAQVAMAYAETLKSEYNTPELRDQVTGTLTQLINTRLRVGTAYGPNSITVVCNDQNNTKNTIAQRKLIIDIYGRFANSIKDVLIYEHVQPLEG